MCIERIGYGAGDRDLEDQPNLLRILVGRDSQEPLSDGAWMLETNMDDCTGELIAHCTARLFECGALDVYTTAIQMKKNRPAVKLSVLCLALDLAKMEDLLFRETTTLGVRRWPVQRHKLRRQPYTVQTRWGPIEGKLAIQTDGAVSYSPEFESCRRVASEHHAPLKDVYDAALKAFDPSAVQARADGLGRKSRKRQG